MKNVRRGARFPQLLYALGVFVSLSTAFGVLLPERAMLRNYDKRFGVSADTLSQRDAAVAELRQQVDDVRVEFDEKTGAPKWIYSAEGFLTEAGGGGPAVTPGTLAALSPADPNRVTKAFLNSHTSLFGFGAEVLDGAVVKRDFITPHNRVRTVVWEQQLDGIPVFEAVLTSHVTEKDALISISSQFIPNLAAAADSGTPQRATLQAAPIVSAATAVSLAASDVGEVLDVATITAGATAPNGAEKLQHFQAPVLSGETEARLVWLPLNDASLRLCWEVILTSRSRGEMFLVLLDAETGNPLLRHCLTDYISPATYRVYTGDSPAPLTPGPATPTTNQPPIVPRVLVTLSAFDTNASPNGWIDDGVNETRGNNVDAHTDLNADDVADTPRPQGSPPRTFDFPLDLTQAPVSYKDASVTELFYLNNWIHDKYYQLGFTEAAGNFQNNNFGRGGVGNDAVQADAQDGSGTDNANFSTPPDGSPGRMQMYVFTGPTPDRDGDLDAEIVIHEYTHGLSNRRVGGGVGISQLQTGGMGEGWSDFYAMCLLSEPGDDPNGVYANGGYVTYLLGGLTQNYYFGIRRYPYCTDTNKNPLTFKDIDPAQASVHSGIPRSPIIGTTANEVHNMGEVWCNTLWEVRANLIAKYGSTVGNQLILQLVTDGMNLGPANPNFLQARDAILKADQVDNGSANSGELWAAFAKRGMGFTATSPASSTTAGLHEAYDVPFLPMTIVLPSPLSETTNFFLGQGLITFKTPSLTNVTITLSNSNPHEISVSPTIIMPAGQTSAVVLVKVVDDTDLDGTQTAVVTAKANSYATVTATVLINDNEKATLSISAPAGVTEGSGPVSATVHVSGVPSAPIVVNLASSDTSEIQVPATVTIPAGQTSANFNLTVMDDTLIDGDQSATITAHVVNWTDGVATVVVHDNESLNLVVTLPQQAREGDGVLPNAGAVGISGTLPTNLLVSLLSDDTTELTVPPSVVIPAGQTSASFNLTVVNDPIVDGSQLVHVIASASGFVSGSTNITITDDESPFPPGNPQPGHLTVNVPANTNLMWDNGGGTELIVNGNFENGTLNNWVQSPGAVGHFVVNNGSFDSPSPDGPLPPFAGGYSALCYETGPGLLFMYQDVTIPVGVSSATLSWAHRVRNFYAEFSTLQQFRVEVRNTNNTILAVAFTTNPGDPLLDDWVQKTFDMKSFAGQKVRVAFWLNPGGYYLDVHLDNVSLKVSSPASGITNDVYFGTNPVPGPAEYVGSTTNSFWTLPLLAPQTTYYWQIVARKGGMTAGPVWQFTTKGVDHFVWDPISSPQLVNQPFNVRLTAKDEFNTTVSNYTGSVGLSGGTGAGGPSKLINFDDLASDGLPVPTPYAGLTWNNFYYLIGANYPNSGYQPGTVSAPNASYNAYGDPASIVSTGLVTLASAYLTAAWNDNLQVQTKGYSGVALVYSNTYILSATAPTLINFNYLGVTRVDFVSSGGTPHPGYTGFTDSASYGGSGNHFVVDNVVIGGGGSPVSISPTNSGPFTAGVWQGVVAVLQPGTNISLRADDGIGHSGGSVPFDVGLSNDISITMTDSPDPVATGGSLTYLLNVGNTGPAAATGVVVSNFLPANVNFVSANPSQGSAIRSGALVRWDVGTVSGGGNASMTILVTTPSNGTFTNRATVSRTGPDAFTNNNSAAVSTTVVFPSLVINDTSVVEGNSGTTNMIFTVTLTPASPNTVGFNYATFNGSALSGSDYASTNGIMSLAPGETNRTISVRVFGDQTYETNETVLVVIGSPVNASIADSQGVGTILNDDSLPEVSIGNASIVEGNVGLANMLFPVTLSRPSSFSVTVSYTTVDGTAVANSDYVPKSGTLTFSPNATNSSVSVSVYGDTLIESNETFFVQLSNPLNAVLGTNPGTGTITNDDGLPGQLDHFGWDTITSPKAVGVPFEVTIRALDAFNTPASNFFGAVNLSATTGGVSTTNAILGNVVSTSSSGGDWTLGYSFTPNTNITVTHVRHYFGTKISIWTDAGTLIASQNVVSVPGTWTETALASPVNLTAGIRYRVAAYTGGGAYYWRNDGPSTFANGTIDAGYEAPGDNFPGNSDGVRWWFADLRYAIGSSAPVTMSPTVSGVFANGIWTGNLTMLQEASNAVVRADDGGGHSGVSNPFKVLLQNDISIAIVDSPDPATVASNLTYTLTVDNSGPLPATGVLVSNVLPASVYFISATSSQGSCAQAGGIVTCDLGTIPGGSNATIIIVVHPASSGAITNTATVTRSEADAALANNQAKAVTFVRVPFGGGGAVAVFGAPGDSAWHTDVRNKVAGTGLFTAVDAYLIGSGTPVPTLAQLQQYDAVLVYSDTSFNDNVALGNVLADYVDGGGGVVLCTFAYYSGAGLGIQGRLLTGGYLPFTVSGQDQPGGLTLVKDDPLHPILNGVVSFNGGPGSYHNSPISIANGATLVGHWNNGQPLIGALEVGAGRVAGLNFYPPSSDARSDFWLASTDGALLMANALLWAAPPATGQLADDISMTVKDSPDPVALGGSLTYNIVVTNSGPSSATGVLLTNVLPGSANLVSVSPSQGTYTNTGGTIVCSLGTINGGSKATIIIVATPLAPGAISNRTVIVRAEPDAYLDNNAVSTFSTVVTPDLAINDVTVDEGNTGTTLMSFTVSLTPPSPLTCTVNYGTASSSAIAGSDFAATNGTLIFAPGQTNKTVTVVVFGDNVYESDEDFFVNLSGAVNANIADFDGIGTIRNDDSPPTISIGNASVVEGNVGTTNLLFPITVTGLSSFTATVDYYTADNTAFAGSDYVGTSGTLILPPGVTTTNVSVAVQGDISIEGNETFFMQLINPGNAVVGTSQGTGTIINDDGLPGQLDHFTWSAIASPQSVGAPFGVTINARDVFNQPATNFHGVAHLTAAAGGGIPNGTVKVLSFILYSDNSIDGEYHHTLTAISNYFPNFVETSTTTTDPATLQALLADKQVFLILEQELAGSGTLGPLGTAWSSVLQNFVNGGGIVIACSWITQEHLILNNSGLLNLALLSSQSDETVTKTVDHLLNQGVTVPFAGSYIGGYSTANGTAVMQSTVTGYPVVVTRDVGAGHVVMIGTDYYTIGTGMDRIVANAVRWAQNSSSPIPMTPTVTGNFVNGVWNGNVSVLGAGTNVVLTADDGVGHLGSTPPFEVVLKNDLSVRLTDAPDPVAIGNNLTYTIIVSNSGPTVATGVLASNILPATVNFVSATSSQGTCSNTAGIVLCNLGTINGGASATVSIVVSPFSGGTITNRVNVSRAEPDADPNNNSAASVTTVSAPLLTISDASLLEGNVGTTNAIFLVNLSPASALTVTVTYATANGSASAGSDYIATNGLLTFTPGQTSKTIIVAVKGDTNGEPNESFFVNLTSPTNAGIAVAQGMGTIINDDVASAVYLRSTAGAPWGSTANETAMDRVFGSGNWQDLRYELINPGTVLSPASTFIFMEGSDMDALELQGFLINNLGTIQNWVSNGGSLFLNAAPNEGGSMNFGFGGVTLLYPDFTPVGGAVVPTHPIFNGPFLPVGTNWSGSSFGHATVSGGGLVELIRNLSASTIVLGEKNYGAGRVLFGGMTTDNFHSPQPQASNLRANIIAYLSGFSGPFTSLTSRPLVNSLTVAGGQATITLNTLPTHRYRVLYADDLTGSPWIQLGEDVIADGYSSTVVDQNAPAEQRFYRIMEVPVGGE